MMTKYVCINIKFNLFNINVEYQLDEISHLINFLITINTYHLININAHISELRVSYRAG